jgi:hypothetical protein
MKAGGPCSESRCRRTSLTLLRIDSVSDLLPDLGPPRSFRHEPAVTPTRTDGWPRFCYRGRAPNGVVERVPDWTVVGFASRTRFLGSDLPRTPLPVTARQVVGPTHRLLEELLHLRIDMSRSATLTRIALRHFSGAISFGWPRRWPPVFAVPDIRCFARLLEIGLRNQELFQFRRVLSHSTTSFRISFVKTAPIRL